MRLGHIFYKLFGAVGIFFNDTYYSLKAQSDSYAIIQTAHRIEKGLTIENPRRLWGWNKVEKLVDLISKESGKANPDYFAIETGVSVLKAYKDAKEKSNDKEEFDKANVFFEKYPNVKKLVNECEKFGGAVKLNKSQVLLGGGTDLVNELFSTRHSVRDFDDKEISKEILEKAIQLALLSPSACNRQPSHVYVLSGEKKEALGFANIYNADKYLVITGDMEAFTGAERGDWVVSSTIFTTYLVLALHSMGIGSCIMRKDMLFGSEYNTAIRRACKIPKNEKIILEIAIGYYKEEFYIAYSNRKKADTVMTIV